MPSRPHSAAFTSIRDALLGLDDIDRIPLARLFGAMQSPEADLTPAVRLLLRRLGTLSDDDVITLQSWCRSYLNRWGQLPRAAGMRNSAALRRPVEVPPGSPCPTDSVIPERVREDRADT